MARDDDDAALDNSNIANDEEEGEDESYETDDETDEDDTDDDDERWSIRVRLLSAVDLPPSLSPEVPLCPWFAFGLVEDVNAAFDNNNGNNNNDDGNKSGGIGGGGTGANNSTATATATTNSNATSRLLSTLPQSKVRCSSIHIMPHRGRSSGRVGRGNGAEWDEEYRWDIDGTSPMEGCLVVQLNARLGPTNNTTTTAAAAMKRRRQEDGGNLSSMGGGGGGGGGDGITNNTAEQPQLGLRGLWRKGREQLEERRRVSGLEQQQQQQNQPTQHSQHGGTAREQTAATVAQYLMSRQDSTGVTGANSVNKVETINNGNDGIDDDENDSSDNTASASVGGGGLCLGTLTIPLSRLPLEEAFLGKDAAIVERWYQLEDTYSTTNSKIASTTSSTAVDDDDDDGEPTLIKGPRRCPSVLLQITFASTEHLDTIEEREIAKCWEDGTTTNDGGDDSATIDLSPGDEKKNENVTVKPATPLTPILPSSKNIQDKNSTEKNIEPMLDAGIVDYVCIIGARDIGNQRHDDGSKGWVQSTPEYCVLERYPPTDDTHISNGRNVGLLPQIEWFCFPEGCKLWRGIEGPTATDMVKAGVSIDSTLIDVDGEYTRTKFDIALGTICSFSWFVLSSNSDVYGSRLVKTYGVVIRFYVPAPKGIDPTQDDFASSSSGGGGGSRNNIGNTKKRLWIPIGICFTTTLSIVGVIEEILLRMCNVLATQFAIMDDKDGDGSVGTAVVTNSSGTTSIESTSMSSSSIATGLYAMLQKDLYNLIVNFSKPMDGIVHCSIPFLEGERLHVMTTPLNGLPPLPHGAAIASACRLLGAEGLTLLLAAAITECRILIHSTNVAHVAMVAEVITALIFPFTWQLPYIPVLPKDMLEILDAPLPFFVGVPTVSLEHVEKSILSEVVVVNLDDIASFTEYDASQGPRTKVPPALPASVSMSVSKAVKVLLHEEDELDLHMNKAFFPGTRRPPRLETEDLPERMFRIHVALQICSLIRGYQECLFFVSASQPVFNRDRFLRQAPALFEDKRPTALVNSNLSDRTQKILSPRSKRFLSVLVNSQHFHQLLERLNSEESAFFHEVMEAIDGEDSSKSNLTTTYGFPECEEAAQTLFESLEQIEQKIPTYVIHRPGKRKRDPKKLWCLKDLEDDDNFKIEPLVKSNEPFWLLPDEKPPLIPFTHTVLQPILVGSANDSSSSSGEAGVYTLSLEYLVELEKNPWRYRNMLPIFSTEEETSDDNKQEVHQSKTRVLPRVKLCEAIGEEKFREWKIAHDHKDDEEELNTTTPIVDQSETETFNLSSILLNVLELPLENKSTQPRVDEKDRERVRLCLEKLFAFGQESTCGELISEAELALRNPSAQRYLFSVLNSSVQRRKRSQEENKQRASSATQVTRLEPIAFEGIVRLCFAVLEACTEEQNYESAYRLLTYTGGFCTSTTTASIQSEQKTIYMTEKISIHPVFADLRLWDRVLLIRQQDQQISDRKDDVAETAESEGSALDEVPTDNEDITDNDAYDSVKSTLYEMVGYNVPAEEVSRFATRISEEKGWFATERGQALLVLARRLTAKRDEGDVDRELANTSFLRKDTTTSIDFTRRDSLPSKDFGVDGIFNDDYLESEEIAWSHPSVCLVTYERASTRAFLGNILGGASDIQSVGSNSSHGLHKSYHGVSQKGRSSKKEVLDANAGDYAGRVAITAMASFGGSAVVTGGIDGSIFLAHTMNFGDKSIGQSVYGVQLNWGGKDIVNDSTSGSVSCIAASKGSRFGGIADKSAASKSGSDQDEEEISASMDGCHIIAGTAYGSLRAWLLKDTYYASCVARREAGLGSVLSPTINNRSQHGSGATSVRLKADDFEKTQEALAGFAIGGHRGGVTCIDLPPRMYRPDSLVSGGEDGLIKLWSLKSLSTTDQKITQLRHSSQSDFDDTDAQGVLTGHEGKIICLKTAWHGDRLLSGGADKTVRLWDLSSSVGKPITSLRGHAGWVTNTHFWGSNTIVSSSTDRSIHLWDTRVGSSPIFALRYHHSPVSDLLLGNRSEPLMVSAGADGSLATWDFRVLSGPRMESSSETNNNASNNSVNMESSRTIRTPMAKTTHVDQISALTNNCGTVKLARAIVRDDFSFFSVCDDGIINEWEAASGSKMSTCVSGHTDAMSGLCAFISTDGLRQTNNKHVGGTVTCSWDGTVRLRRMVRKSSKCAS